MSFTEWEIRPSVKALVEEYGVLNITELIKLLSDILDLDEDDRKVLNGRNDNRFSHTVRNVAAHVETNTIVYKYGFIIDKTQIPAKFYAKKTGIETVDEKLNKEDFERIVLSKEEIEARMKKNERYKLRRVDYKRNEEISLLECYGEVYALEWEYNRLKDLNVDFDILEEVIHVSKQYSDVCGYDILSKKDSDGSPLYIEVKTTKGDGDTPFYMSKNEKSFMEEYRNDAVIYRIYNFDYYQKSADVLRITQDDLERDYYFDAISFKVMKK